MSIVSIVIPVYNNSVSIVAVVEGIRNSFKERINETAMFYLVDDSSNDGTAQLMNDEFESSEDVKLILLNRNIGQVGAIMAGLSKCEASGPIVITSADGQDPADAIVSMIDAWRRSKPDMVVARKASKREPSESFHRLVSRFYPRYPATGFDMVVLTGDFAFSLRKKRIRFLQVDMLRNAKSVDYIDYQKLSRSVGRSEWTLMSKVIYASKFIVFYTPIMKWIGVAITLTLLGLLIFK